MPRFNRQLSCGLTVRVDQACNVVIETKHPKVTVTDVHGLVATLTDARIYAQIEASR